MEEVKRKKKKKKEEGESREGKRENVITRINSDVRS